MAQRSLLMSACFFFSACGLAPELALAGDGEAGACCQGGQNCSLLDQISCEKEGHHWLGPGTTCDQCPSLPTCPPAAVLLSHPPADPSTEPTAYTSEFGAGLTISDNFSGAAGPITGVTFWGLDLLRVGNHFEECVESDPTFTVQFRVDAAGTPGGIVCSHVLMASRTPTGVYYGGKEMNEYHVDLPTPCILTRGWITLIGEGEQLCWFLWMASPVGDNRSWCAECPAHEISDDLAFCLHGTPGGAVGACCDDATSVCTSNVLIEQCLGATQRFSPDTPCESLDPPCGAVPGACCFAMLNCTIDLESTCLAAGGLWLGGGAPCGSCPCLVPCPEGGESEGEPTCVTGYVDAFNAGCTVSPARFRPMRFGDTICGVGGFYTSGVDFLPDADWYEFTAPTSVFFQVDVTAEMPIQMRLFEVGAGCPATQIDIGNASACQPLSLGGLAQVGTRYWISVNARVPNDASACPKRYSLTLYHPVGCARGDVNFDGTVDGRDIQSFVDCLLNGATAQGDCFCADADGLNGLSVADVGAMVARLLG